MLSCFMELHHQDSIHLVCIPALWEKTGWPSPVLGQFRLLWKSNFHSRNVILEMWWSFPIHFFLVHTSQFSAGCYHLSLTCLCSHWMHIDFQEKFFWRDIAGLISVQCSNFIGLWSPTLKIASWNQWDSLQSHGLSSVNQDLACKWRKQPQTSGCMTSLKTVTQNLELAEGSSAVTGVVLRGCIAAPGKIWRPWGGTCVRKKPLGSRLSISMCRTKKEPRWFSVSFWVCSNFRILTSFF